MKGIYALIIFLEREKSIEIGSLGKIKFQKGFYVYVGTAQNSLEKRIERHISKNKKIRWHIDYLLKHAKIKEIWIKKNAKKSEECKTARAFTKNFDFIPNFGSSDCSCKSHLFYSESEKEIERVLESRGFVKYFKD